METQEVHDSLMRRLQLIERKVSLISIQLGQLLDLVYKARNSQDNALFMEQISAAPLARPTESKGA